VTPEQRGALVREALSEENPDAILFDGLDAALVGYAEQWSRPALAVYDLGELERVHVAMGMTWEEASEYVSFNVVGLWAGEHTPLILYRVEDEA
jgi:hypothetical protein